MIRAVKMDYFDLVDRDDPIKTMMGTGLDIIF